MRNTVITLILVLTVLTGANGQEPKRITRTISQDDAVILREIGAVIVPKNEQLVVEIILGNHEKSDIGIKQGDIVLMANGKKIKSVRDLRAQYDNAQTGNEFKLGVKREEELMLVKFLKKSKDALDKEAGGGRMMMRMEQKEGEVILPALGLKLITKNNSVIVAETLPTLSGNFKTFIPAVNDIIRSLNSQTVTSAEAFDEIYTALNEGESVTILFSRSGKESIETFPKPKPMGRRIMMTR